MVLAYLHRPPPSNVWLCNGTSDLERGNFSQQRCDAQSRQGGFLLFLLGQRLVAHRCESSERLSTQLWRSSLQMTSFFLHMYPAAVSWTQRWHRDQRTEELLRQRPELAREWDHASLGQLVLYPLLPYLFWALAYYAKVRVLKAQASSPGQGRC